MPKKNRENTFQKLTRLFKSGVQIKRRVKNVDYKAASSVLELFKKTHSNAYGEVMGTLGSYDRLSRLSDYSEMNASPEIFQALNVWADETVSVSEDGRSLHIYSENSKIRELLGELFYDTLNVEFNMRGWARNLVQFGDFFGFIDVDPEIGIINMFPLPINEIVREEGYSPDDPLAFRFRWTQQGNAVLENWQVAHMRLMSSDCYLPYGTSVLDGARRIWRQLVLMEDAMLTYRVVRSPDRRVFYIDVGAIPPEEVDSYMEHAKTALKTNSVVDRDTGKVDMRNAPLSVTSDFFIAVRGGDTGTKIETLPGGVNAAAIEDVTYLHSKLMAALGVPRAYLGFDEGIASKATLACLTADTVIPLANGKRPTIAELAAAFSAGTLGKQHAFSYDHETSKITCGEIERCWKTKETSKILKITLDNDKVIECTDNHPFMLRDGSYRRADELMTGDSLMPLYERLSDAVTGDDYLHDYHQHMDVRTSEWVYTHRVFAHEKYPTLGKYNVIHHVDFDRYNNDPSNLLFMKNGKVHRHFHGVINRTTKKYSGANNPRFNKAASLEKLVEVAASCSTYAELLERSGYTTRIVQRLLETSGMSYRTFAEKYMPNTPSLYRCSGYDNKTYESIFSLIMVHVDSLKENERKVLSKNSLADSIGVSRSSGLVLGSVQRAGFKDWLEFKNKVVRQLTIDDILRSLSRYGSADAAYENEYKNRCSYTHFTWTIRVLFGSVNNARERAGIRRYGGSPKIQRCQENKAIINHKVKSIEIVFLENPVPVYDLTIKQFHNFALGAGVFVHNSQEIRFSRSVQYIQRVIISELNKLAIVHLYCNGYDGDSLLDFELRLPNPSAVAQQQKLELFRSRFEIASLAPEGLLSKNHLRKHVFGMTDDEIELNELEIERDELRRIELEKISYVATGEGAATGEELGGLGGGGEEGPGGLGGSGEKGGPPPEIATGAGEELVPTEKEPGGGEARFPRLGSGPGPESSVSFAGAPPIKPNPEIKRMKYNNGRIRHHGASKTHMPNFRRMMSPKRIVGSLRDSAEVRGEIEQLRTMLLEKFGSKNGGDLPLFSDDQEENNDFGALGLGLGWDDVELDEEMLVESSPESLTIADVELEADEIERVTNGSEEHDQGEEEELK